MSRIEKVRKAYWTQPNGKMRFQHDVFYESGRRVHYSWDKNLPITVVNFLIDCEKCDVTYEKRYAGNGRTETIRWEEYTN